ncbi:MAG: hypothetical protein BAJALOKI2v1_580020 [Promethearchaeota archaeon]|nr:MAG: hypothetical protein BAJALOKI2v1_580020 [Candidatus Lokiarchaeota archaeon]
MINWDKRFEIQLKWTRELRDYLFQKIELEKKENLLDIGCGTGLLINEIGQQYSLDLYGIDIHEKRIALAQKRLRKSNVSASLYYMDFLDNQFKDKMFDVIATNCFFLWISDIEKGFKEIYRILKENGILLILAEPDYGGLIEYPDTNLKHALCSNLKKEGADPEVGRKLNQFFIDRFEVKESFCNSIPWIANVNKESLFKELDFFKNILTNEKFDEKLLKMSIKVGAYFIYVPIFSYYLEKV